MSNNINIEFFDEYKRVDKLCADMYGKSSGGVTSYIDDMASVSSSDVQKILDWYSTYNKLKSLRHIRNQMAHGECSFDDYECSYDDIKWLRDFRNKIMNVSNTLAIYRRNIEIKKQLKNKHIHKQPVETWIDGSDKDMYFTKNNSDERLDLKVVLIILFLILILIIIGFSKV